MSPTTASDPVFLARSKSVGYSYAIELESCGGFQLGAESGFHLVNAGELGDFVRGGGGCRGGRAGNWWDAKRSGDLLRLHAGGLFDFRFEVGLRCLEGFDFL